MRKNAYLNLYGEIGSKDCECDSAAFARNITEFEKEGYTDLTIRLHSPGGSVFEGFNIFNSIKQTTMNVKIMIDGIAASMASVIILATKNVEIAENGFIMIHRPSAINFGDAESHESTAKLLQQLETIFINEYSARTGISKEEVKAKWLNGKDNWINATEAVNLKFASRIIPSTVKDIKLEKYEIASMGIDNLYSRFAASLNTQNHAHISNQSKNWNWYQMNDPRALDRMPTENPSLFAELYKAEFGCYPDGIKRTPNTIPNAMLNNSLVQEQSKDWNWYQANNPRTLERMPTENPSLFAELYKAEFGCYPDGIKRTPNTIPNAMLNNSLVQEQSKDWNWYQANNPRILDRMPTENPSLFAELYKAEFGCYPKS